MKKYYLSSLLGKKGSFDDKTSEYKPSNNQTPLEKFDRRAEEKLETLGDTGIVQNTETSYLQTTGEIKKVICRYVDSGCVSYKQSNGNRFIRIYEGRIKRLD